MFHVKQSLIPKSNQDLFHVEHFTAQICRQIALFWKTEADRGNLTNFRISHLIQFHEVAKKESSTWNTVEIQFRLPSFSPSLSSRYAEIAFFLWPTKRSRLKEWGTGIGSRHSQVRIF